MVGQTVPLVTQQGGGGTQPAACSTQQGGLQPRLTRVLEVVKQRCRMAHTCMQNRGS